MGKFSMTSSEGEPRPRVIVLGYGNTLRGDDGFGWRVAEAFARIAPDFEVRAVHQLGPEIAEAVSRYEIALFVDAATDGEPGTVRCRQVSDNPPESELSHQVTPAALLCLARRLYGSAPHGVEITVCGESFDLHEGLSARVEAELPRVLRLLSELAGNTGHWPLTTDHCLRTRYADLMKLSVYAGDITTAPAEVVCTSTNPRLSLMMGTGGAVRERGGFGILRACEAITDAHRQESGKRDLRVGSVHVTNAGTLPYKAVIHCVAGDHNHVSSLPIVRACVLNALAAASREGWKRVAMPVFGTGHAHLNFRDVLETMATAIRESSAAVEEVIVVVLDEERAEEARRILGSL